MTDQNTRPTPSSDVAELAEKLMTRARTMNGGLPVGASDGCGTIVPAHYSIRDRELDIAAARALSRLSPPAQVVKPLEPFDGADDEAINWVGQNLTALRRDDGSLQYSFTAVVRAFQAGKASASPAQVEVTDEMVEAGEEALNEHCTVYMDGSYTVGSGAVRAILEAALTATDAKPVVPAKSVAEDDGWRPIETAPFREIVDLWCLEKDSPASWDGKTPAGEVIRNRHKSEECDGLQMSCDR